jgi:hypothetical protein
VTIAKSTLAVIGAVLLVVALAIAGWQLNWFVAKKNVNRQTGIDNSSTARQSALQQDILTNIATVRSIDVQIAQAPDDAPELKAQRVAIVSQVCDDNAKSTHVMTLDPASESFTQQECP